MPDSVLLIVLSAATAAMGALGGLGGAVILVPLLVLFGWSPAIAAPLGLTSVAAGSIAAAPRQLSLRSVNHRIGIGTELAATTGAVIGALVSGMLAEGVLVYILAAAAVTAAIMGGKRKGLRNPPDPAYGRDQIGETIGSLSGAYPIDDGVAPYKAHRLPLGLALVSLAGLVAGMTGTSGGYIKTPVISEVMRVPTKVAASTVTFTVGITASAALIVMAIKGRIDPQSASAVVAGGLVGGFAGALGQSWLSPTWVRRGLSIILIIVAIILVTR